MRVLSTLALKGLLEKFKPPLEQKLGAQLELHFDATQSILAKLQRGEQADVLILTVEAMQALDVKHVRKLGSSGVGIAVRAGAPRPDIGSVDALKRALLSARSVAHSKVGASGIYFAQILERLGIADRLKQRIVVEKGPVGLVVASGEAELGVQQLCELAPVAGIEIVGPLPAELQKLTHFAAGIPSNSLNPEGARKLIEFLRSETLRAAMPGAGMQPAEA
jgi:molybdate transport system substrate-binding protein